MKGDRGGIPDSMAMDRLVIFGAHRSMLLEGRIIHLRGRRRRSIPREGRIIHRRGRRRRNILLDHTSIFLDHTSILRDSRSIPLRGSKTITHNDRRMITHNDLPRITRHDPPSTIPRDLHKNIPYNDPLKSTSPPRPWTPTTAPIPLLRPRVPPQKNSTRLVLHQFPPHPRRKNGLTGHTVSRRINRPNVDRTTGRIP
jgi:hypothetical protein